ncbi:hypothetical protein [Prescottella agglutinans]|uniref:Uncharacterized protein n=1 Tax=Prescottella agglutinans TaxID=1644129 RepID=A0ABT6M6Y6_9NOCA|nr:hypothetical protein [Prescottella agglutinans]MDH6279531.1 hypothetical protein [Prescottella agglutinans]
MSGETVGIVLAAINGIGIAIGGIITVWRSVATTNVKTLEERLGAVEADLASEFEFSTAMARWAHDSMIEAAAQGITLPDIPKRRAGEE